MNRWLLVFALGCVPPINAHHSTAPYDMTREASVTGVVTKFYWANPHAYIYIDVPDPEGVQHWSIEVESPNLLRHQGWTKESVKAGNEITCKGARAKIAANFAMKCFIVDLPDGRRLLAQ